MDKAKSPHILMLPSWYPSPQTPLKGSFFRSQAQALHKAGCNIGVIYPDVSTLRDLSPSRVKDNHFQFEFSDDEGVPTLKYLGWYLYGKLPLHERYWQGIGLKLYRRYVKERGKPDLVLAQSSLWAGIAAKSIKDATGCPYVIMEHSSAFLKANVSPLSRELAIPAFKEAKAVLCVSDALSSALVKGGYVKDSAPIVIPNMVDTDFFVPPALPRRDSPFLFVAVGSLIENKGGHILLQAFAASFKGREDVRLLVVGDGPERASLLELAKISGIDSQVEWAGSLSEAELLKVLWRANAFVHASFWETFGIVIIEAMATGLPVVVTDCGGPASIVKENSGVVVPIRDVDKLTSAMATMRDKASQYDPNAIRNEVVTRYSTQVVARELMEILETAAG